MTRLVFPFLIALTATDLAASDLWIATMNAANEAQVRREFAAAETGYRTAVGATGSPLLQAFTLTVLGSMYARIGRFADAERCYLRAAASAASSEDRWIDRRIAANLSALYLETGQLTRAEHAIERFTENADNGTLDRDGATLLNNLGSIRVYQRRYTEAEGLFRSVIDGLAGVLDGDGPQIRAMAMGNLSEVLVRMNRTKEAAEFARASLAILESVGTDTIPDAVVKATANVALFAAGAGRGGEAEVLFHKAIREAEAAFGPGSYLVGTVLHSYSLFLRHENRRREARKAEDRSARILAANARENLLGFTVEAGTLGAFFMKQQAPGSK